MSLQNKEPDLKKFQDIGLKLTKIVSDDHVPMIEENVQETEIRWKNLNAKMEDVAKDLFTGKEQLEKFRKNMENIEEWLAATETKLSNLEAPSSKPDKVKDQIKELNVGNVKKMILFTHRIIFRCYLHRLYPQYNYDIFIVFSRYPMTSQYMSPSSKVSWKAVRQF